MLIQWSVFNHFKSFFTFYELRKQMICIDLIAKYFKETGKYFGW